MSLLDFISSKLQSGPKNLYTADIPLMPVATSSNQTSTSQQTGNVAQRHNNPGNLVYAGQQGAIQGEPKAGGGFWAKFPDVQSGMAAFQNDNSAKLKRNPSMTLAQLIDMRSPPTENSTSSLHYNVVDALKDLKDKGVISTLMANKLMVSNIPPDRLAQALAQAEGFYATNTPSQPQINSRSGLNLPINK
ncbi:MAG: hypothetical protein V4481_05255 [Patescibacteria group bacterium]